jgi:hypothetical protein
MTISRALQSSPFGRLPAELRLLIWEYAMYREGLTQVSVAEVDIDGDSGAVHEGSSTFKDDPELVLCTPDDNLILDKLPPILSLTQTCHQIRHESMPIFLSSNSFVVHCPIFDSTTSHGSINPDLLQSSLKHIETWQSTLNTNDSHWSSSINNLTLDLGLWQITGCKASPEALVNTLTSFSASFPPRKARVFKIRLTVQWRMICPCCESQKDDESVWPLVFELERGKNDAFFEAIMTSCKEKEKYILEMDGVCGRTKAAWLMQLERTSGRLVEGFAGLQRSCENWMEVEGVDGG